MSKHTPGPWTQGVTLVTRDTRQWSAEQIAANDAHERRMVFVNFSSSDEGRGRRLIATCEREEDAQLIADAPRLYDENQRLQKANAELLRALKRMEEPKP